ncbi:MAG: hypothetical protein WCP97_04510 [bacterium]
MPIETFGFCAGTFGAVCILLAYGLLTFKIITQDTYRYQGLNFLGAIGIIINTAIVHAWPAMTLDVFWALIAFVASVNIFRRRNHG